MPGKAVGWAAVDLPWLCPNTTSLIALAENPGGIPRVPADPAFLAFLCRFASSGSSTAPAIESLLSPLLPDTAAAYLNHPAATAWLDPERAISRVLTTLISAATTRARHYAQQCDRVDPDRAEIATRLAPLGWYAIAAMSPDEAWDCYAKLNTGAGRASVQEQHWGLEHDAITRRLASRWRFPDWLLAILGHLKLPLPAFRAIHPEHVQLFAVVKLALAEAGAATHDLGLAGLGDREELLTELGHDLARYPDPPTLDFVAHETLTEPNEVPANPRSVALLPKLLKLAGESRRRNGAALAVRLEQQIDTLHRATVELGTRASERLRDAKLVALAELAAGAGHEINNPLAVISGNAQRLLRTEPDSDRADSLRAVVRQTQRISAILRELMLFARPPKPELQRIALSDLLGHVRDDWQPAANERGIRLEVASLPAGRWLEIDCKQLRQALGAVVRNAIEAVPPQGWVKFGSRLNDTSVTIFVEDSGPGLDEEAIEHAFDPFYCGRSAGRGRGLGLSMAWQLARQNGAELRYSPTKDGTTCFLLTCPVVSGVEQEQAERQSA